MGNPKQLRGRGGPPSQVERPIQAGRYRPPEKNQKTVFKFKTLGFWIFRKDMIFPYGNISGNVGEEFLRRKKNAGFGFREVEITYYLLSEFFWVQHINLDVDLLKKNNVIQRIFYCSLCDRSMAFHVDWGPLSQFDVRRRSVVGFHYSSHSG